MPPSSHHQQQQERKLNIAVIHPDLGLGGAEKLIVNAAVALQSKQNNVHVYTAYHDKQRAFNETVDGTLNVSMYGNWFPRTILGRLHIFCTIIRMIIVTFCIWLFHRKENYHVFLVDQVSAHIPFIRLLFPKAKVVFYCHFPDKLLVQGREGNIIKKLYRIPFDWLEELTTGMSDRVLVNSKFTLNVYKTSFPSIARKQEKSNNLPQVLYPAIDLDTYDAKVSDDKSQELEHLFKDHTVIASVNRFERKKGIDLLVHAFAKLVEKPANKKHNLLMVLAGGCDARVPENVEYLNELKQMVENYNLQDRTVYKLSFTDSERYVLFHNSQILAYTPENEHFGIVPVEAMYCGLCVVAVNSGGPLESIVNGKTGLLTDPEPQAFADALQHFLDLSTQQRQEFGKRGRQRVKDLFSMDAFADHLNRVCQSTLQ
jgi:alpha-1,3/alpha-1,6-mannosyltransferase